MAVAAFIACAGLSDAGAVSPQLDQSGAASTVATIASATTLGAGDVIDGMLPFGTPIHVEIALKMRNRDLLDSYAQAAAQPNALGVRALLTPEQFAVDHAPTPAQVHGVVHFLTLAGFHNIVVAPNSLLISADATSDVAQSAFSTSFARVQTADGRDAFANTDAVHIPAALSGTVLAVLGLQTVHQAHTFAKVLPQPNLQPQAVTGHYPNEFSSIYGGTGVATAAGVTVGIITQGKITQTITDLNSFTAAHGFPTVTTQTVNTNGTSNDTSGIDEWNLDSQDVVGMAGGQVGQIIFYNEPTLSNANLTANINTVVSANAAKIINMSLGECETSAQSDGSAAADDQLFATAVAQGQTFSISTGDSGADECNNGGTTPSNPADSPYVVAVAGTTLDASTSTWNSETVWSGSGGSESTFEPKPSWQTLWNGSHRGVADVAFDGDPNSGAKIIVKGSTVQVGGTSLSAPIFAGMWARVLAVKGTSIGFAGPIIYQLPATDFHDITSGNNNGSTAGPGYDLASGRGSIILSSAINHIGGGGGSNTPPVANFSFTTNALTANFTDSSSDSDGTIASRAWDFGDGATSSTTNPSHTYGAAGTYTVSLEVTDNGGATNTKTQSVTVAAANVAPVANFGVTTNGLVANFTDSSTDSDGTIASRAWTFGDGATSTSTNPSHTYAAAGTYSVSLKVTDNGGLSNTKTSSVTVSSGGGGGNVLQNGVTVSGLAATTGNSVTYTMVVPAGATNLKFTTSGGNGDGDLYVKFGSAPTTSNYDCRSWNYGNSESCSIANAQAGTYYVTVYAYASFTGDSLTGSYSTGGGGGGGTVLQNGVAVNGLAAAKGKWTSVYTLVVPAGATNLSFTISGGTGDADLYVRLGSAPTTTSYDCRPYLTGNNETCSFSAPAAGTYYVSLRAYATFSGVTLTPSYTP